MAEAIFRDIVNKKCQTAGKWTIQSAGTWTKSAFPAAERSIQVMKKRGLDITTHRSKSISNIWMEDFDLVLTMETGQKEALHVEFPGLSHKVFLISEMINSTMDINDPMGKSTRDFEETAVLIENILTEGFPRILTLLGKKT